MVGWTRARERVLHTFSSLSPVAKVYDFPLCQMDNVLLLNSGGSVVQLDTTDSGPRPHASPLRILSKHSKQIVKYSGFRSQIKGVL